MTQYDERDLEDLGPHFQIHLDAMTSEGLHSKAAIAAELAWRDAVIEEYQTDLRNPKLAAEVFYAYLRQHHPELRERFLALLHEIPAA